MYACISTMRAAAVQSLKKRKAKLHRVMRSTLQQCPFSSEFPRIARTSNYILQPSIIIIARSVIRPANTGIAVFILL